MNHIMMKGSNDPLQANMIHNYEFYSITLVFNDQNSQVHSERLKLVVILRHPNAEIKRPDLAIDDASAHPCLALREFFSLARRLDAV